jgi:hypothetical protein
VVPVDKVISLSVPEKDIAIKTPYAIYARSVSAVNVILIALLCVINPVATTGLALPAFPATTVTAAS